MKVLFVHNNFPAQFRHVAARLARDPANEVRAIGADTARAPRGVQLSRYAFRPAASAETHPFARRFDLECRRAEQALYAASMLGAEGFRPDAILAHGGWGEALPLRSVWPDARILNYCEYFYRARGSDVNFDPEFPSLGIDGLAGLSARNAMNLLALADADLGVAPTLWQRSTYPAEFASKIRVVHEGVDTELVAPDPAATCRLEDGRTVGRDDEIVTFVARNLEPLRGYHVLMRALPAILKARPAARVLVVGGFGVSYGQRPPAGKTWHQIFLDEVAGEIDASRVHFLGHLPYGSYLDVLRVSAVHVYLTYPFVLSWSCLEAMAAGCVLVASDTQPVREVIADGENGLLVPFHAPERLAETVIGVLSERERHARLGAAARRTIVERFDAESVCVPAMMRLIRGASAPGEGAEPGTWPMG
ncbi:glycosyltransferase family 4 protein [Antarcticirhabdus aurantiaca]|uniref:Glycosyltransferase family 4 protein n=1 Tax=Antarcticirhabdus aurantiaca TaxID=2606717 RepID=A0ACD4NLG0_9HYPH|nr:glycosyltransferase family 4 protein [Antarcticirhabdus aurantiaca]WAJ27466.1 glycosyltransferase family 4 protein [Jeongeuplla avenae]